MGHRSAYRVIERDVADQKSHVRYLSFFRLTLSLQKDTFCNFLSVTSPVVSFLEITVVSKLFAALCSGMNLFCGNRDCTPNSCLFAIPQNSFGRFCTDLSNCSRRCCATSSANCGTSGSTNQKSYGGANCTTRNVTTRFN